MYSRLVGVIGVLLVLYVFACFVMLIPVVLSLLFWTASAAIRHSEQGTTSQISAWPSVMSRATRSCICVVERITEFTGVERFPNVLDVACGTGQSTLAIAEVSDHVIGIDAVPEMLPDLLRTVGSEIELLQARAESLPFAESAFDLIALFWPAFHWFDQEVFRRGQSRRCADGWLVIYNIAFLDDMVERPGFRQWFREEYLARYPSPPRSRRTITDEFVKSFGLKHARRETFASEVPMSRVRFVDFVLTQSNVIAAVEGGSERLEDVAAFVDNGVRPFFHGGHVPMRFQCDIDFSLCRCEQGSDSVAVQTL